MLFQRLATALLLLAISGSANSLAASAETSTETTIKRAPTAKPFKPKQKGRKPKRSSKTASTKSIATTSTPSKPASTTHTTTHTAAAATLRPAKLTSLRRFLDQLHQLEADPKAQLVRVIQFGDSHTAGDSFTGALRTLFQQKFGAGRARLSF